ncbi:outer membrane lipoprotein carrier protein LolA [Verrucomicrobiaceae bacterium R5-34]|uniref:Outer membrane lipoprotein carrier protein LolA n=1 Tax=Oceaniferula flava TaxID=2800421 RepID=A0AAE2SAN1_9BACT|nr:outer membrane lipoprotein carrier protein LolA [Oceaniferula flavus]MBK1832273.1 outer membrane lipoprotein carrier protein LolA [Verrucomicrobiaceae bacterium R5-34]MBK1854913.1 outer membrane lipoprotein carrier protein LolA [Oceaniferula flavus]MBM1136219.1 outer membrane lipoprotein carrier protein LolA [Oceaniferula flavus]
MFRTFIVFVLAVCQLGIATAAFDLEPLKQSYAKQKTYTSVKVKMRQTKKLPSMTQPVKNTGYLWLMPGKAFRWQLGDPKVQSAVFDGQQVYLLNEKKKTAEAHDPNDRKVKPLLLMLGIGEAASFESLLENFEVTGVTRTGSQYAAALSPKSGKLKRVIVQMVLQVSLKTDYIERIEWTQKDGSVIITEFARPELNAALPKDIFVVDKNRYQWK